MTAGPHTTHVRVRYAETDQQGVAHHAQYFVWMEAGRVAFLRDLGFPYDRVEAEGTMFPVVEASCRYMSPVRFEEEVEVETRCRSVRSRGVVFDYDFRVAGRLVATGSTSLVALGPDRRPVRIPEALARALDRGTL